MCFSPAASFLGGLLISGVGIATVKKIYKPSQIVFASIPLFFGIQQIAEGALWLSLQNPEYLYIQKYVTYIFLIMADVLWPMMIPFRSSLWRKTGKERKYLLFYWL